MEEFQLNIFGILNLFGTLQGLILLIIFLLNDTYRRTSNLFLSLILGAIVMLNILGVVQEMELFWEHPILFYLPIVWHSIIPAATYFFVQYLTNPSYTFKSRDYLFFLPFIIHFGLQLYEFILLLSGRINLSTDLNGHLFIDNVFESISAIYALVISILILRTLSRYEKSLYEQYAEISDKSLKWMSQTLIGGLFLICFWTLVVFLDFFKSLQSPTMGRILQIGLSVLIYWIGYSMLMRRELFVIQPVFELPEQISEAPKLSEKTDDHYRKLLNIMQAEKLYRNPDINMSVLSKEVGLSKSYLSQIINTKEDKNFFDFINAYRVAEIKQKMADPKFDHFSILALALDAGFKSKSTFNAVFKKITGMTPSQYKKQLH